VFRRATEIADKVFWYRARHPDRMAKLWMLGLSAQNGAGADFFALLQGRW